MTVPRRTPQEMLSRLDARHDELLSRLDDLNAQILAALTELAAKRPGTTSTLDSVRRRAVESGAVATR